MNIVVCVFLLILLANGVIGAIYQLNESEYARMPSIYKLDSYDDCLQDPTDVYCSISFNLVSDKPNNLLDMIKAYSEHKITRYNHIKIRYGICVSKHCQHYMRGITVVSESNLEACLNETLWKNYNLKTKVKHYNCYSISDHEANIDASDVIIGLIMLMIIMLNVVGTQYDYGSEKHNDKNIRLIFSIKRNWRNLMSAERSYDHRLQRCKGLDGLRCIIVYGVIMVHCFWPYLIAVENARDLEMTYHSLPHHILFNGSIMIQAYFVISGFLLAYKMEISSEKHRLNWSIVPKGLFLRYLRLTPAYALLIALSTTWLKFFGPGPFWEVAGEPSLLDCRKRWWLNLLYLNNYVYDSQCMLQAWYLATDMQLFCLGLIVCILLRNRGLRKTILLALFTIGILLPAVHTYIRDLHSHMIISPGESRSLFKSEPTFNEIYKNGHGNITSFVIGMALGYLIYGLQKRNIDITKYQKLKYMYWTVLPLILCVILSGSVFYRHAPRDPLYIRVIYAALAKPVLGALIAVLIAGMIFKLENVYRPFFECSLWTIPSKLSYCMFLLHFPLLRAYLSLQKTLLYLSTFNLLAMSVCIATTSLIIAVPLHLLVEKPFIELTKHLTPTRKVKT